MATTRLRRAFHYPDDSDHEHVPHDLDEQEQEQLIQRLQSQHDTSNAKYTRIFTLIPLLSAAAFLPSLLRPSASLYERVMDLVSVASLTATAYAMRVFGVALRGRGPKGKMPVILAADMSPGGLLLPVNAAVCGLLVLVYALADPVSLEVSPVLYLLPAAMLATVLVAQKVMASVDPSLLQGLRYEYKGA